MALVARCEKCGKVDPSRRWESADDASKQGAFERWTCQNCAWTEFELVDEQSATEATTPAR
jgi:hypothetical protein